jgi:hypothetical protein
MNKREILELFTQQQRIELDSPGTKREAAGGVIRHTAETFGFIVYSNLSEDQVDAAIDDQITYYSHLGIEFEWKVYDYDQPADLKERLSQRGF